MFRRLRSSSYGYLQIDRQWGLRPDEIDVMTVAYEKAQTEMAVASRDDPITELIAKAIVNAKQGH